jgi:hypothetical protein
MTFELRKPAQDCQHQSTMWRCRIRPRIAEGFECCASFADCIECVEQIARAARKPI